MQGTISVAAISTGAVNYIPTVKDITSFLLDQGLGARDLGLYKKNLI